MHAAMQHLQNGFALGASTSMFCAYNLAVHDVNMPFDMTGVCRDGQGCPAHRATNLDSISVISDELGGSLAASALGSCLIHAEQHSSHQ